MSLGEAGGSQGAKAKTGKPRTPSDQRLKIKLNYITPHPPRSCSACTIIWRPPHQVEHLSTTFIKSNSLRNEIFDQSLIIFVDTFVTRRLEGH